jgi:hypothetical protein
VGWSAEATVRGAVKYLRNAGALDRRKVDGGRRAFATALTPAGEEMLVVARVLEKWLAACPKGPVAIEGKHVKIAVQALAEGWTSTLMRALASGPSTLTELSAEIPEVSYPALERRITWMRTTGQVVPLETETRGTPYVPTEWLRRSIAPIAVAGRCERRHMEDAAPVTDVEVETAFLLSLPLVDLPAYAAGSCTLASQTDPAEPEAEHQGLAGVAVSAGEGKITSWSVTVQDKPSTWAIGSPDDWLDAVLDGSFETLRAGGQDPQLAIDLANGLHYSLSINR